MSQLTCWVICIYDRLYIHIRCCTCSSYTRMCQSESSNCYS